MVLYRPCAKDYYEAMRHLKLFDTVRDVQNYIINYHNLYNIVEATKTEYIIHGDGREINDERNGWQHSRLLLLGTVPMGVYDAETLRTIEKPKLYMDDDPNGGLKCHFELLGEEYIFFLGVDQWYGNTKMLGYKCKFMSQPYCRCDDIPVTREDFTQEIIKSIATIALKKQRNSL